VESLEAETWPESGIRRSEVTLCKGVARGNGVAAYRVCVPDDGWPSAGRCGLPGRLPGRSAVRRTTSRSPAPRPFVLTRDYQKGIVDVFMFVQRARTPER
jgi:hypothetical protein